MEGRHRLAAEDGRSPSNERPLPPSPFPLPAARCPVPGPRAASRGGPRLRHAAIPYHHAFVGLAGADQNGSVSGRTGNL